MPDTSETMKALSGVELKRFLRQYRRTNPPPRQVAAVLHSVAYPYNVGAIFRLADGAKMSELILCGITPEPPHPTIDKVGRHKARNVPWKQAANDDGTFKNAAELRSLYIDEVGLSEGDDVVAYCRIGERSSHTWFVLTHLLGFESVVNYDGSWTEWGNMVRAPIERPGMPVRPEVT